MLLIEVRTTCKDGSNHEDKQSKNRIVTLVWPFGNFWGSGGRGSLSFSHLVLQIGELMGSHLIEGNKKIKTLSLLLFRDF